MIQNVINAVSEKLNELHSLYKMPGKPYVSYRIPQIYHTGVCIYFMLGMSVKGIDEPEEKFSQIEHILREVIIKNGGSISHHHGVGKLRKDFLSNITRFLYNRNQKYVYRKDFSSNIMDLCLPDII